VLIPKRAALDVYSRHYKTYFPGSEAKDEPLTQPHFVAALASMAIYVGALNFAYACNFVHAAFSIKLMIR
jgi:hypothetical protein